MSISCKFKIICLFIIYICSIRALLLKPTFQYMRKFLFLLSILFSLLSSAQKMTHVEDSLATYSFKELLNKYESYKDSDPTTSLLFLNKMSQKAATDEQRASVFIKRSRYEIFYGTTKEAFNSIDNAIELLSNKKNSILLGEALERKGFIYYYKEKDYNKALSFYLQASSIAQKYDHQLLQITVKHKIAALYFMNGDTDIALQKYRALYEQTSKESNISYDVKIGILKSLSNAYFKKYSAHQSRKALLDSAMYYGTKGIALSTQEANKKDLAYLSNLLGIVAYTNTDYSSAIAHLATAKKNAIAIGLTERLKSIHHYKGMVFLAQQQPDSAIYYFKKNIVYLKDTTKLFSYPNTYALLAESYEQKDDLSQALKYAQLAIDYTNKTYAKRAALKYSLDTKYDLPNLKQKSKQLAESLAQTAHTKNIWIGLAITLSFILLISIVLFKRKERLNKEKFNQVLKDLKAQETVLVPSKNTSKTQKNNIPEEQAESILKALNDFENGVLFTNPDCTLRFLAEKLATNTSYLSKVINTYKKQSYTDYLIQLRIKHALKRLKNEKLFRAYSIESIAKECGFKSAKSFSRAFKKHTDIYPSYYIKNIENSD